MNKLSFGKYISSIYRNQSIIINKLLTEYGFGSGQYLFLLKIAEYEGITQNELSQAIHIDRANTNRAVAKLEKLSYIQVVENQQSKRNKKYCVTPEGKVIVEELKLKLSHITEVLTRDMNEDEKLILNKLLIKMEDNVSEEVDHIRKEVSIEE